MRIRREELEEGKGDVALDLEAEGLGLELEEAVSVIWHIRLSLHTNFVTFVPCVICVTFD